MLQGPEVQLLPKRRRRSGRRSNTSLLGEKSLRGGVGYNEDFGQHSAQTACAVQTMVTLLGWDLKRLFTADSSLQNTGWQHSFHLHVLAISGSPCSPTSMACPSIFLSRTGSCPDSVFVFGKHHSSSGIHRTSSFSSCI